MMKKKVNYTVKPETPVVRFDKQMTEGMFDVSDVAVVVGMQPTFIRKVVGKKKSLSCNDVCELLEQDAFSETFVPRSKVIDFLLQQKTEVKSEKQVIRESNCVLQGDSLRLIGQLPDHSVQCVVTSTPYWAMRVYDGMKDSVWADGEVCPFGLEQTPEGFVRHSVEVLYRLKSKIVENGSIWWDVMDTFNTRTQIRSNAAEALHAMQGKDKKRWSEHSHLRYSAGHSFLKDGEQCFVPFRIAERASRIGYFVKSIISWCKSSSLPEPQQSRVSRNVEYVLHFAVQRMPKFYKERYLTTDSTLGGKQVAESEKLSDFWYLPTSAGRDGHGAQFPLQLPGRCISISTDPGDLVLDPFAGAGTTLMAARQLKRRYLGFDMSAEYVKLAKRHTTA